jgi:hypothetical protein
MDDLLLGTFNYINKIFQQDKRFNAYIKLLYMYVCMYLQIQTYEGPLSCFGLVWFGFEMAVLPRLISNSWIQVILLLSASLRAATTSVYHHTWSYGPSMTQFLGSNRKSRNNARNKVQRLGQLEANCVE